MSRRDFIRGIEQRDELIQIARRKERVEVSLAEARAQSEGTERSGRDVLAWFSTWFWAWPQAKTRAMEEEIKARPFEQSWAEVWTRKEAEVWARAMKVWGGGELAWALAWALEEEEERWAWKKGLARVEGRAEAVVAAGKLALVSTAGRAWVERVARAEMRVEAAAVADAMALAGVWIWARSEAHAQGESVPSGLADSATICRILSDLHRLWHHTRETREEYACITHFIAPITRLPFELLYQILFIIIDEASNPPLVLMLVCTHWHAIVSSMWASLNLGTRTPMGAVRSKLERNQWLDIVVDTDSDRGHFTPSHGAFEAIFAALEASSRWRSLVVESFPAQADLTTDVVNRGLQRCPNIIMSRFTTFKIKCACETSPLLDGLLRILGMTVRELTTVEINSANVIAFLAPAYPSIFYSVKVLSLNTPGMPSPVDLLPHLHQLEAFTASHISFPIYHEDVNFPFVHTLRHLYLRAVSIQWMSGRTFHALEHCTLIFPLHQHVLHTFSTTLPICKHLMFQGYPLNVLGGVSASKLDHLSVTSSGSSTRQGNQQLVQFSRQVLGESRLRPHILHIRIEAGNQAWMNALVCMWHLEELVIHSARPSSLGAKVFRSLIVQPVSASHLGEKFTHGDFVAPSCPSLRRFGLKYDRWLRPSERFNLIPVFVSIIRSRKRSNYHLENFRIWTTSDGVDPLELIERLEVSANGFGRLAEESGIQGDVLDSEDDTTPQTSRNTNTRPGATTTRTPRKGRALQGFWNRFLG